ncbi:MAG: nuclear transport factor 2 family protein [Halieaceae bacterium]|jgi:uncharacterized protein (TIGR02246 family)|nr:nuclear transport factor 2 family protein [Halieaceae bacterium]
MTKNSYLLLLLPLFFCGNSMATQNALDSSSNSKDIATLTNMIEQREHAMISRDIGTAMSQFSEDITWINSQGYLFEGKQSVLEFHTMLANNKTLDYSYEAGKPRIRITGPNSAIVYYSWKMFWFSKGQPDEISNKEIGLMTLSAQKQRGEWHWIAVTNQHTPWFYETIDAATID